MHATSSALRTSLYLPIRGHKEFNTVREISSEEVMLVSGAGIYTDNHRLQFRDMAAGAIIGGIVGGPVGFAGGLLLGAITGYRPK